METIIKQLKDITGVDFKITKGQLLSEGKNDNILLTDKEGQIIGINTNITNIEFLQKFNFLSKVGLFNCTDGIEVLNSFKNLTELYIINSQVPELSFLSNQLKLIVLHIRRSNLQDISHLKNILTLQSLDLWDNNITDISSLQKLVNLSSLVLWENSITDITVLKHLINLIYLDLEENNIGDITALSRLTKLERLYLSANKIEKIKPICGIQNLRFLFIRDNPIVDLENINRLVKLETLNISGCDISNLEIIDKLVSLQSLFASMNRISELSVITSFTELKVLDLANNLIDDLYFTSHLHNLEQLNVSGNLISDLTPLEELINLRRVDLSNNKIKNIRSLLPLIEKGIPVNGNNYEEDINLEENPLEYPSYQILRQGNSAVLRFFKKIDAEGEGIIYEAKLTFVGEGSAGKTSLMRRLINPKASFPQEKNRTRGISIEDWVFKKLKHKKHVAHIWDFGGQDVYYPVHRFFLTENSVFVLLASSRQNSHHFDYWIPTIYQFGGKSPIIIGQTCHDGHINHWNDIGEFVANENFNIIKDHNKYYHELNLPKGNKGLAQIKRSITTQIINLPHYKKNVPKSWLLVRELLKKMKNQNCISYIDLKEKIVNDNPDSFKTKEDVEDCIVFFHSIGVVLWYQNELQLESWVILNPKWAVDAVYKIIDFKKNVNKGIILSNDFDTVWKAKIYDDKHSILKNMLEVFKIAFPKKSNKGDYIMPTRLDSIEPQHIWSQSDSDLKVEYHYDFMPKGLANQISAELSKFVNDNEIWNNAVNLYDTNSKGQIFEDFFKRRIIINTQGEDSRALMSLIMNAIKDITDGYKGVRPKIVIPCPCNKCLSKSDPTNFSYSMLLEKIKENSDSNVYCNISEKMFSVETLLFNIGITAMRKGNINHTKKEISMKKTFKIFLASSAELENERRAFREFISVENDRLHQQGIYLQIIQWEYFLDQISQTRLQDEYNKALINCDIAVCLFFSKVGMFTENEFNTAYENFSANGSPRIWTYFKNASMSSGSIDSSITTLLNFKERLKNLGHFATTFDSNSDLHLKFKRQIEHILDEEDLL